MPPYFYVQKYVWPVNDNKILMKRIHNLVRAAYLSKERKHVFSDSDFFFQGLFRIISIIFLNTQ